MAAAIDQAKANSNPELTPDHLLAALDRARTTRSCPAVLAKLGQAPLMVRNKADEAVDKLPKAYGGDEPRLGRAAHPGLRRRPAHPVRPARRLPVRRAPPARHARAPRRRRPRSCCRSSRRCAARTASRRRTRRTSSRRSSATGRTSRPRAREGKIDPVIGRDDEIRRVIQVLSRRTKNNPVLIGEPGVGKTAIVEGLARRIADGDVPEGLKTKRLDRPRHRLDAGRRQVPRRVRGAAEGRAQGDHRRRRRDHHVRRRAAHHRRRRRGRGRPRRRQHDQADARPRRAADDRRDDARRVPQVRREGPRPRAALPAGVRRPSRRSRTPSASCAA